MDNDTESLQKQITGLTEIVQHLITSVTALEQWKAEMINNTASTPRKEVTEAPQRPMSPLFAVTVTTSMFAGKDWQGLAIAMQTEVEEWEAKIAVARAREEEALRRLRHRHPCSF